MKKCCYCLSLTTGARLIGLFCFLITLGLFVCYLVFLEEIRIHLFEKLIFQDQDFPAWCSRRASNFYIDMTIDSLLEYSLLANLLLVMMCTGGTCCSRWLLMPWLIMYFINICCLLSISIYLFIVPMELVPLTAPEFPALRSIGLVPLVITILLGYFWVVIFSLFRKMSSDNEEKLKHGGSGSLGGPLLGGISGGDSHSISQQQQDSNGGCCSMQLKTGVQIICGFYAILSSLILVAYYATLERSIIDKYLVYFGPKSHYSSETSRNYEPNTTIPKFIKNGIPASIIVGIAANLLAVVGCCVSRWRRVCLLTPWLIFYGVGILVAIVSHQWFTTDCWVEEKVYGIISLALGFVTMIVWTLVWIVSAEAYEKPKVLIGRNPLGFQRL